MHEERERCLQIIDNTLRYHEARGSALVVQVLKNLRARVRYGSVTTRSRESQAQPYADLTNDNTLQN
jgi:hypothetical protein